MKTLIAYLLTFSLIFNVLNYKIVESNTDRIPYYFFNAASAFKIDVALLYALCSVESRCRAQAINRDDATAYNKALGKKEKSVGLFQIKLATAKGLGFKGNYRELMKPEVNTWYAAKLLRHLYERYGDTEKVISAYNAGHFVRGNKQYVYKVYKIYVHYKIDLNV